jgi:glucuronoarabinoxylan endo-1,4-beta-xylanase
MEGKEFTKRACVMGNWSRFVRPGFVRVEATPSPQANVLISAFCDQTTHRVVIVIVNLGNIELEQKILITNGTLPSTFTLWTTSDSLALEQTGNQTVSPKGMIKVILPPGSVTTLVSGI